MEQRLGVVREEEYMEMKVGLFFYIRGSFVFHGCPLQDAEKYGDFLIYPESHFEIWEKHYAEKYGVDFDFFPRCRIAYRKTDQTYLVYYDRCIGEDIHVLVDAYCDGKVQLGYDEHYQCHQCNTHYVV